MKSAHRYQRLTIAVLLVFSIAALGLSLLIGSVSIVWNELISFFRSGTVSMTTMVVLELRLPRAFSAFVVGSSLAVAGVMMQVLLRNPLADPYVLGVSGGSAAFALIVMLLGFPFSAVPIAATIGAGFSIVLLIILARTSGDWGSSRLLLTGIVLASGWGALIGFFLSLGEANQIQGMLFWLMGDLRPEWPGFIRVLVLLAVLIAGFIVARDLDLLLEGDLRARSLGLNTSALRLIILLAASLLTAASVTLAGPVGFIGLVVPHMMRLIIGSRHRLLIPVSALAGGTLLVIAEMIARTVIAPQQLPVGVITSFIGVPIFLYLLRRRGLSIPS
ncbi:iron ABC transporter permease [Gammaproteobacteria bacterium]|nr:iron ABC transporter permease [Gammaproteobacteria bacterium]